MRPARILLLLVAIIAGGLAAFLATRGGSPTVVEQVVAPQPVSKTQVLVAKQPIGVGERLSATAVEWQPWPEDAVRPEYITIGKTPDAPTKIAGAVARFEIFQGEPILDGKLAHSDQGYLSAVLDPGMRGVSISVSAPSASGGFIIPNDRVDVLVTDSTQGSMASRVVLSDVKVLAIGTRLGQSGTTGAPADPADPKSQVFTSDAIATLELTPGQAQTLITSSSTGKVSLVLRSVADFGHGGSTTATKAADDNQTIKIIRFGRMASVLPGSTQQPSSAVGPMPVAYVPPVTVATEPATTTSATTVVTDATSAATAPPATPTTAAPASGTTAPQVPMAPTIQ